MEALWLILSVQRKKSLPEYSIETRCRRQYSAFYRLVQSLMKYIAVDAFTMLHKDRPPDIGINTPVPTEVDGARHGRLIDLGSLCINICLRCEFSLSRRDSPETIKAAVGRRPRYSRARQAVRYQSSVNVYSRTYSEYVRI